MLIKDALEDTELMSDSEKELCSYARFTDRFFSAL